MESEMNEAETSLWFIFCIGFAAGAGVLPYSKAEYLLVVLSKLQFPGGEE